MCNLTTPTAHMRLPTKYGYSTILPVMDFETYSDAGHKYHPDIKKWIPLNTSPPYGIGAVGASAYSEHPSTDILSLAYDLKDGMGPRLWIPGMLPPHDLFNHITDGGIIEAWNSIFEFFIWKNVCHSRMRWPKLPIHQLRDAMAKSYAFSYPGKLKNAGEVSGAAIQKLSEGDRLIRKFSKPRNPTKKDHRLRIKPLEDLPDAEKLYEYNTYDIKTEAAVSQIIPDLHPEELKLWLLDQKINSHGVHIDMEALDACKDIIDTVTAQYVGELKEITGGAVESIGEIKKITEWIKGVGVSVTSIDAAHVEELLKTDLPDNVRRVLEIRSFIGSASVKKLHSIALRVSKDEYLRGLFQFCGGDRTKRFAGRGPQPQNLPNSGPDLRHCVCGQLYHESIKRCPKCLRPQWCSQEKEWGVDSVAYAIDLIKKYDIPHIESILGPCVAVVSGCLRGLFCAAPGKDLISSDYNSIEAVVLAMLADEPERIQVFKTHGKIYELSASKISGIPFQEFLDYKNNTGNHHPLRKKIGKVAELASGYQGSVGAWKAFGADKHFRNDDEILAAVRKWRRDNPNIVKFWYGLEDAARSAIQFPGRQFKYRDISYQMSGDVLFCKAFDGRTLQYHNPKLTPGVTPWGREVLKISYMGWNSNSQKGPVGWMEMDTYGGKLVENVVQWVSRCILSHAMINLDAAGYQIVLHVHDEPVAEVPEGFGSIEEFERIMIDLPPWAKDWPVRASGGWRGKRYRKD